MKYNLQEEVEEPRYPTGPKGRMETVAEKEGREAHNLYVKFSRTFSSAFPAVYSYVSSPPVALHYRGPACPKPVLDIAKNRKYSALACIKFL